MDSLEKACNDAFITMEAARVSLDTATASFEEAKASFEAAKAVAEAADVALNLAEGIYHSLMKRKELNEQEVILIEDDIEPRIRIRKIDEINALNNNVVIDFKQGECDEESISECSLHEEFHEDDSVKEHETRLLGNEYCFSEDEQFCNLFPCQLKKGFKDVSELYRHQQVDHFKNSKPYKCCECGKEFDDLVKLQSHGRSIHEKTINPVFNVIDDIVDYGEDNDDDEVVVEGFNDNGSIFECFFCGESFENENELWEHARRRFLNRSCVSKDDPVVLVKEISVKKKTKKKSSDPSRCMYCGKTFSSLLALKKHTEQSLRRKYCFFGDDLKCKLSSLCLKRRFSDPNSLFEHQQKKQHFGDKKPFKCFNCGTGFETFVKLYSHEESIHNNVIHAIFNMNNDVMEFTYYVRNDTPDHCHECGKKFANKEKFDLHMKAAHPAVFEDKNSKDKKTVMKNK